MDYRYIFPHYVGQCPMMRTKKPEDGFKTVPVYGISMAVTKSKPVLNTIKKEK